MSFKTMLAAFSVASLACVASAQAPLAGQAGSDTLKRAQAPAAIHGEAKTPDAKPAADQPAPSANDTVEIGVISKLNLTGDAAFIADEDVEELLAPALADGAVKRAPRSSTAATTSSPSRPPPRPPTTPTPASSTSWSTPAASATSPSR